MHLLILKVNHLGDNVVFLPVVQTLRRLYPDWRLTVVTAPQVAALYQADVAESDLLLVRPDRFNTAWKRPWELVSWAARLKARRFDAALVSYDQGSVAHGLAKFTGAPIRVGAANLKIRLRNTLTSEVALAPGWSMARWNWETARALVTRLDPTNRWPAEPPAPNLDHLVSEIQPAPGRIVIHAGSKQVHTRWPLERFVALADRLSRQFDVSWIDTPETSSAALARGVARPETRTLAELVKAIAGARLFVGNNSGPMHLASALGTPGVVISGPSAYAWDPAWNAPRFQILRTPGLACLPCEQGPFSPGRCLHAAEPMACMQRWSVESVEAACRAALARTAENL
ncbi:MAG: heptosyltransferase-2/heptosyltransferase-3 [Verrucomicrobia bacterium]|jgi:ADP-heptose:LPS heptosyltransferase|nr:MAG: heptosyltransferase-2/heptosyltransferase-3 [Verrucomicrobiota bacterium]